MLVLPYLGLPRIGNVRAYAAAHKLFLPTPHTSEERLISLVTRIPFSAISTEQLEGGVSPYEPVVTISHCQEAGERLVEFSHSPCLLLTTSTEHHCYPAGLASYGLLMGTPEVISLHLTVAKTLMHQRQLVPPPLANT